MTKCAICKKEITTKNKRKYCSHECYLEGIKIMEYRLKKLREKSKLYWDDKLRRFVHG